MLLKEGRVTHRGPEYPTTWRGDIWNWNPLKELSIIRETMNELFSGLFSHTKFSTPYVMTPPINMYEMDDELVIETYIPGVKKEDINITVTTDTVVLSGEMMKPMQMKEERMYRCEMPYGKFFRTINLPFEVKTENIKANCIDGILRIHMPVVEPSRLKTVKVNIE